MSEAMDRVVGMGVPSKYFDFTALVLGQYSHSHIEPGQTGETAENEESQEDVVKGGANTQCERGRSRSKAERNLSGQLVIGWAWLLEIAHQICQ